MTNVTWAGRAVPPALLLFLAGCATVAHGTHQRIPVQSDPSGARVQVDCGDAPHHAGFTPVTVELPRKAEFCGLTLMKAGFLDAHVVFERIPSGATAGNHVAGVAAGVAVGVLGAVIGALKGGQTGLDIGGEIGYEAGTAAGSGAANGIDQRTGAAFKYVPSSVLVKLEVAAQQGDVKLSPTPR